MFTASSLGPPVFPMYVGEEKIRDAERDKILDLCISGLYGCRQAPLLSLV